MERTQLHKGLSLHTSGKERKHGVMEVKRGTKSDQLFTGNGFGEIADEENSVGFAFCILHDTVVTIPTFFI